MLSLYQALLNLLIICGKNKRLTNELTLKHVGKKLGLTRMHSKQRIQTTRSSKTKTVFSYLIAGQYLMCSSLAYAGPSLFGNDIEPGSKTTIIQPLGKPPNELQKNDESSSSYFSFFKNTARSAFIWLYEFSIANYFKTRKNSGFVEGLNNKIKGSQKAVLWFLQNRFVFQRLQLDLMRFKICLMGLP